MSPALVLVCHGSRDPAATSCAAEITAALRQRLPGTEVRLGFVDIRRPTVTEAVTDALGEVAGAVVVPAFLAAGFHVRVDLPAQLAAAGTTGPPVRLAAALGADPALVAVAAERLAAAGWRPGDTVVLAAAGSSDQRSLADVRTAARLLGAIVGRPVRVGFVASAAPRVDAVVADLRAAGGRRVAVASWLLAPGVFERRLDDCGADVIARPLGAHPTLVDTVVARYTAVLAGPGSIAA